MSEKSIIAIPMGDPAGIGPEITAKSLMNNSLYDICKPLVIGDKEVFERAIEIVEGNLEVHTIKHPKEGKYESGSVDFIDLDNIDIEELVYGEVQKQCGKASYEYIETAVNFAMAGDVHALATTPINKESLELAKVPYIGHTEMLEALTNSRDPLTMFEVKNMRIFFLTRHLSLKDAIAQITKERVSEYLLRCDQALERLGVKERKIAVAGLNPHSGEGGLFGDEEIKEIKPGIEAAREEGIDAVGPVPADSVFHHALNGRYDAVLSLYHDQGHIAAKMTDFYKTISVTNGLPFIRTSVDHGTAFDIAGKNVASSVSMERCIELASKYAKKI